MKEIRGIYSTPGRHWVGDGFPVRSLFSYGDFGQHLSPFLLLDYAGPESFAPTQNRRGVGEHPHRGFETVTIVYQGELEHRDSSGGGGKIGPGDVQWMTAGAGIVHEEFHSAAFAQAGGTLEMVQLWVNLPAKHKMTPARYQTLLNQEIPVVELPDEAGKLRVIAGEFAGKRGPAQTFSPLDVWDLRLHQGREVNLSLQEGDTLALVVLRGAVKVNDRQVAHEGQFVHLAPEGTRLLLQTETDAIVLLLSGEPLNEPIRGYGPFVMNSDKEIAEAIEDYNSGQFGRVQ